MRRRPNPNLRRVAGGLVAVLAIGIPAAAATPRGAPLPALRPVVLPRDHGAHPGFQVEWWYTAGTVAGASGRPYFWFATVWSGDGGLLARLRVVDLRRDRVVVSREYLGLGAPSPGPPRLRVGVGAFSLAALGRETSWQLEASAGADALSLRLTPRTPYVLHGRRGIIPQGLDSRAAYYSEPRLDAEGVLRLAARRISVHGLGWLDHQWGNFAAHPSALRWNWFACQLGHGRDLMLYEFLDRRDRPAGPRTGTLVTAGGTVVHLHRFGVQPLTPSIHPAGAPVAFPLRWRLTVPAARLDLVLRSRIRHGYVRNFVVPSFWEAPAAVTAGGGGHCIVESSREAGSAASG